MSYNLVVEPEAADELEGAVRWYEERSAGLGLEFARVVRATLAAIERSPFAYPEKERAIRYAVLRRFPYTILFLPEDRRVAVLAIFHDRRDPADWQSRR